MSYILDALKKSQQQRQGSPELGYVAGENGQTTQATAPAQTGIQSQNQSGDTPATSQIPTGLWLVVVILLATLIAALVALWRPNGDSSEVAALFQDVTPEAESKAPLEGSADFANRAAPPKETLVPAPRVRGIQSSALSPEPGQFEPVANEKPQELSAPSVFAHNSQGLNQSEEDFSGVEIRRADQPAPELKSRESLKEAHGLINQSASIAEEEAGETSSEPKSGFGTGSVQQRTLPPLSSLRKVPDLIISSHVYSRDSPESRSVSMNGRSWYEGELIVPGVFLESITAKGIELSVDGYSLPVSRKSGWQGIGGR